MAKTTKDAATEETAPTDETAAAATDTPSVEATPDVPPSPDPAVPAQTSDCVVDDGTPHMGRAVNGKVCSAHAMNYRADGTPRTPQESMATMHPRRMK